MDNDTLEYVRDCVENEGFHYCFDSYSDFAEVRDAKFHELRKAYLKAAKALSKHIKEETAQ